MEEQVKCNGRADDFSQIAGRNRDLSCHPEGKAHLAPIGLVAQLRQVALGGYAQFQAQAL